MLEEIREKSKLFCGGLPYKMESEQLKEMFLKFGEVKSYFVAKGKGYGFVEFALPEEAEKAKEALNDTEIEGRKLKIDFAFPKKERKV